MKFDAAALFGVGEALKTVSVTIGDLRAHDVLVRMTAAGICHTDLTVQHGRFPAPMPIILGHEGSGIVEAIGSKVTHVVPGDPVVLTFMSCGHCELCNRGDPAYCISFGQLNFSGFRDDGSSGVCCAGEPIGGHFFGQSSFARYSLANTRNVVKVRRDAPLEMLAPFGCGVQTGAGAIFNVLKPDAGTSCLVFGAGGVGLSAVMAAKINGCDPIIVVEPRSSRRELALELGATVVLDPKEGDVTAKLIELTDGCGAAAIVDTTGLADIVTAAISALGPRGKLGLIGMSDMVAQAQFTILGLLGKGASIHGIVEGSSEPQSFLPRLVDLFMEGRLPVDKLVSFYSFDEINAAIAAQISGEVIKPVLIF